MAELHTRLALSIRQPWAEEIFAGTKTEEYRSQPTNIRGWIYIYAGLGGAPREDDGLPRGVIVGEVTLYGCRKDGADFAWLLKEPIRWETPQAPRQRANPVWFKPWGEQSAPGSATTEARGAPNVVRTRTPNDLWETSEPFCVVRQYFSDVGSTERSKAVGGLAHQVGYRRTGSLVAQRINHTLRAAVKRGIVRNDAGVLSLAARGLDDLPRDLLKAQLLASLGRQWAERDDAMREFARWMGFRRTGAVIDDTCRSLINGLLREGRLEADGSRIRRT